MDSKEFQTLLEKKLPQVIQKTASGKLGTYEAFEPALVWMRNYDHVLTEQQRSQVQKEAFRLLSSEVDKIPTDPKGKLLRDFNAKEMKNYHKRESLRSLLFYFYFYGWASKCDYEAAARNANYGVKINDDFGEQVCRLSLATTVMLKVLHKLHPNRADLPAVEYDYKFLRHVEPELVTTRLIDRGCDQGCIYAQLFSLQDSISGFVSSKSTVLDTLEKHKKQWSGDIKIGLGYYLQGVADYAKYRSARSQQPAAAIKLLNKIFEWMEKALAVEQLPESHHLMVYLYWELARREAERDGTAVNLAKYDAHVVEHIARAISNGSSLGMLALAEYMSIRCSPQSSCFDTLVGGALVLAQRSQRVPIPFYDVSSKLMFADGGLRYASDGPSEKDEMLRYNYECWQTVYDDSDQYEHQPVAIRAMIGYLQNAEQAYGRKEPLFSQLLHRLATISPELQQLIQNVAQEQANLLSALTPAEKRKLFLPVGQQQSASIASSADYDHANTSTSSASSSSSSVSAGFSPQSTPPHAAPSSFFNTVQYPPAVQSTGTMPRASAPPATNPMLLPKAPQHTQYLPQPSAPQMTNPMQLPTASRASAPQMTNPMQLPGAPRASAPQMTNPMQLPTAATPSSSFLASATVRGPVRRSGITPEGVYTPPPPTNPEYASTGSILPSASDYADLVEDAAGHFAFK